jgi:hypothetical protein
MNTKRILGYTALLTVTMSTLLGCGNESAESNTTQTELLAPPSTAVRTTVVITIPPTTTTTIAPTTTTPDITGVDFISLARDKYGRCGEFHDLAISVGWTENEWPKLSRVMWKESRCTTDAWNGHDAGLTQINQIHSAWLADMGHKHPDDMFDPAKNLAFAYRLWHGREEKGQCGWQPWSISC